MRLTRTAHGLRASLRNNGQAYGFSVVITAALGLLNTEAKVSGSAHFVYFALGAALAFSLLEAVASVGFRRPLEQEPGTVTALGISLSLMSVGASATLAWGIAYFLGGVAAWPVTALAVSVAYPLMAGVELAFAQRAQESSSRGGETGRQTAREEDERRG
ncbi:hypothetical protein [Streptomyces sp. bgisy153]|uniref:hypothetical protein n=1 Tax=Streptomyces sp. bgisy153 TaxID=3413793 RepID=UPI003D718ACB